MADDLQEILRRANEALAEASTWVDHVQLVKMRLAPLSEQKRYESMVMYHAQQLGKAIGELATWLQRGTGTTAIAQRHRRGKERRPRAIRE